MRIGFDAQAPGSNLTGAGKAFAFLLRRLRADHPQHDYVLLAHERRGAWRLPRQLFWEQVELPARAWRAGADVLHVTGGTSAPLVRRGRLVMTVHDLAPTRHPELLPGPRSRWYWGRWVPRTARAADLVLVPSAATRNDLVALAGVPEARIRVVPWGVALEAALPAPAGAIERARAAYGLPGRYVLYVGTIDRRKDYGTLLEAVGHLDPRIHLVVAGTVIEARTDFPERVTRLGLGDRVRVLGYVPERDLPALYGGAAVFVYPSFYEGFGLPVLEAMACGTPVVTYRTTSLPEVVGDAGVLLEPPVAPAALAAELSRLTEDGPWRRELVGRGLARAARFDWGLTARLTVEAYESLVTG